MSRILMAIVLLGSIATPIVAHAAPTCSEFVNHIVDLSIAELGKESMFGKKDIPELTKGCEKAKNLPTYAGSACVMKAKTLTEAKACKPKFMSVMESW